MVQTLDQGYRTARKTYRCGLCAITIKPGDRYAFQTNIYDDRIYTWRDCVWCDRDAVLIYVHDFTGGYHDEGVDWEAASEWAAAAVGWPQHWLAYKRTISALERTAARNWLARAAGDE